MSTSVHSPIHCLQHTVQAHSGISRADTFKGRGIAKKEKITTGVKVSSLHIDLGTLVHSLSTAVHSKHARLYRTYMGT